MKIGIAITTTPKRIVNIQSNYLEHCASKNIYSYIHNDVKLLGPPSARNICIKKMIDEGCEYMFLFDDDCYPIMYGFDEYIIKNAIIHDIHFAILPNSFKDKLISFEDELTFWSNSLGCFSFFTRKHIEEVGYYNTDYVQYGYTDPPYTYRSRISDLSKNKTAYTSFLRIPMYIKSEDLYHLNPVENFNKEEKNFYIKNNKKIFEKEIEDANKGMIYYPYSEKNV